MIKRICISKEDETALVAAGGSVRTSTHDQSDYSAAVIKKPWGYEYSFVKSGLSDAWLLSIGQGQRTSMHCHQNKKTSIVLLGGECEVTTFSGKTRLKAGDGIVIDKGVFHSTEALSPSGIFLLETETPVDKKDLVRLKDSYGRAGTAYEGEKYIRKRDSAVMPSFYEPEYEGKRVALAECHLSLHDIRDVDHFLNAFSGFSGDIVVVLEGGVRDGQGNILFSHADAFHTDELTSRAGTVSLTGGLKVLYIKKI